MTTTADTKPKPPEHNPLVNAKILADLDAALLVLSAWDEEHPQPKSYSSRDDEATKAAKKAERAEWEQAREPFRAPVIAQRNQLDLLHLPIGTRISYYTNKGYAGGSRTTGTIVKVTRQSYLVQRDSTIYHEAARISRDLDTLTQTRNVLVINGPTVEAIRREATERKSASSRLTRKAEDAKRSAESALYDLNRARNDALRRVGLLGDFGRNPAEEACVRELIKRHQDEYDTMLTETVSRCEANLPADTPSAEAVAEAQAEVERLSAEHERLRAEHQAIPMPSFDRD